jgi:hypothetical protein
LEQEFAQERDDVEQHMEDLKKQWMEAQRKTNESDSLTNNRRLFSFSFADKAFFCFSNLPLASFI